MWFLIMQAKVNDILNAKKHNRWMMSMMMMIIVMIIIKSNNKNICELGYLWSKMNLGLFLLVIFRGAFADKKNELCAKIVYGS